MRIDFQDRHVVVTGGTGALGAAVIELLLEQGAICHVPARGAGAEQRIPSASSDRVHVTSGVSLTDESSVQSYYAGLPEIWASIHSAGGFAMAPIAESTFADFSKLWSINTASVFLCSREAVRAMRNDPSTEGGRIVNVAARAALEPRTGSGMAAYTASKAAVSALTQSLAEELAPEGIWVNAVAPSIMNTKANRSAMPDADPSVWPEVQEVAATIVFLASPANTSTRGAVVPVYGRA